MTHPTREDWMSYLYDELPAQVRSDMRAHVRGDFKRDVESAVRIELAAKMRADFDAALAHLSEQGSKSANAEAQALVTAAAQRLEAARLTDQHATLAALQRLTAHHAEDYAALRKELETVAILTEAGLQRAKTKLQRLPIHPSPIQTANNSRFMKTPVLALTATIGVLAQASAAELIEFHGRVMDNLKAVRDRLVRSPARRFCIWLKPTSLRPRRALILRPSLIGPITWRRSLHYGPSTVYFHAARRADQLLLDESATRKPSTRSKKI